MMFPKTFAPYLRTDKHTIKILRQKTLYISTYININDTWYTYIFLSFNAFSMEWFYNGISFHTQISRYLHYLLTVLTAHWWPAGLCRVPHSPWSSAQSPARVPHWMYVRSLYAMRWKWKWWQILMCKLFVFGITFWLQNTICCRLFDCEMATVAKFTFTFSQKQPCYPCAN